MAKKWNKTIMEKMIWANEAMSMGKIVYKHNRLVEASIGNRSEWPITNNIGTLIEL